MEIRRARPGEYADVGDLCVRAYTPSGMAADDPYFAHLRDAASRDLDAEVWVAADEGGALLGTVTWCSPGSPLREISADGEDEFRMLATDPSRQGAGVGRELVAWCVARARADGARRLVLSSAEWMTTAHRLYERAGFRRTAERDWAPRPDVRLRTYSLDL